MEKSKGFPWRWLAAAWLAVVLPIAAHAGIPAEVNKVGVSVDVTLAPGGLLYGRAVAAEGGPLSNAEIFLAGRSGKPVVARTNRQGVFAYKRLRPGVYRLSLGRTAVICRVWGPKGAPPGVSAAVQLVADTPVVRGQSPPPVAGAASASSGVLANPLVIAGAVAVGVAVPVAISSDAPPAS